MPLNVSRELTPYLAPGARVVDVGASVGLVTLPLARVVGETGLVLAVEPHPANARQLRDLASHLPQVQVVEGACVDRDGPVTLYACAAPGGGTHTLRAENTISPDGEMTVAGYRLDTLLADWPRLDAIKLDAQGAEGLIVRGGREVIRRFQPCVLAEIWPAGLEAFGWTAEQLEAELRALGLRVVQQWGPSLEDLRHKNRHASADWLFAA